MLSGIQFQGMGIGFGDNNDSTLQNISSHVTGATGLTQYAELVVDGFSVFDKKSGKPIYGPVPIKTLWQGFGNYCNSIADPIIRYDQLAHRWVIMHSEFYKPNVEGITENYVCIAVSANDNATGAYYRYAYQFDDVPDYVKLGIWPDAYYLALQMQSFGSGFVGTKACAVNRSAMLNGKTADMQCYQSKNLNEHFYPADLDGQALPPANNPGYYLGIINKKDIHQIQLWKYKVDWNNSASSIFSSPFTIEGIAPFMPACDKQGDICIPQPRTPQLLSSLSARLMYRLAYRQVDSEHGVLLVNHAISGTNTPSAIRWYQMGINNTTTSPKIIQQGTYLPTTDSRWMGSIAMDKHGNIALGYNISNGVNIYPSIAITGRMPQDVPGILREEKIIKVGTGVKTYAGWADYSSMVIDPVDDCTFWYTAQYQKIDGSDDPFKINFGYDWSTYVASFKFANCQNEK
jgi:hypothetical protein